MKKTQNTKPTSRQRVILAGYALLLVAIIGVVAALVINNNQRGSTPIMATADPVLITTLTALPEAVPLTGTAAAEMYALEVLVAACDEYSEARRTQINQHIRWLRYPAETPQQVLMAMAATNRSLLYGIADLTATEWRQRERPAVSCLRDLGLRLNDMLAAAGETPLAVYDETPAS